MRSAREIDDFDEWQYRGKWKIDPRPVLIQNTCLKSRRKYTMGEQEFGRNHVEVFGSFVFSGIHACFGPRHEREIHVSHTRATANRWGEDDSACVRESDYGLSSSLSNLISNQPTSATFPLS